ncbi:hypothetical protein LL270_09180 [Pseudomonas aestusnigri]|uniref:hypothetical protein n=1 Tax=Halopseudomonas aestusnigri TaxID=857252 RepID=UPI001D19770A|nr:hypothetical protein [Halopseudomonas aestusnigri]MCC4260827.1 hypothetical protein [Halopseudomonas aestusnigri]
MSKPEIVCWSCDVSLSLSEREESDGLCPHCSVEIDLDEYLVESLTARAADKARIAELEDIISELIAGTGTSPGADRKYGRARAALAQQGKEGET